MDFSNGGDECTLVYSEATKEKSTDVAPLMWRFLRVCEQKTLHKIYLIVYFINDKIEVQKKWKIKVHKFLYFFYI